MLFLSRYPPGPGYHGFMAPPPPNSTTHGPPPTKSSHEDVDTPTEGSLNSFQRSQSLGNRLIETPPNTVGFDVKKLLTTEEDKGQEEVRSKQPSVDTPENELIRQRRLQRFYSVPVATSLPKEEKDDKEDSPS